MMELYAALAEVDAYLCRLDRDGDSDMSAMESLVPRLADAARDVIDAVSTETDVDGGDA